MKRRDTTAQHRLLAEQIGLGFLGERRSDDPGARAPDPGCIRERVLERVPARVLMDRDEPRNPRPA